MNKWKVCIIVDVLMLIVMAFIIGLGLLIKFVLLPGEKVMEIYGANYKLTWLGYNRHDWGTIHLYLGICFMVLLIIHLALHWGTIKNLLRCLIPGKSLRLVISILIIIITLIGISFWKMVKPEFGEPRGGGRRMGQQFRR